MASYSVAEAKDQLPKLLNAVERGEDVKITRRGKLVAELRAIDTGRAQAEADAPEVGSTAWLLAEISALNLPKATVDSGTLVRAMRDETGDWS